MVDNARQLLQNLQRFKRTVEVAERTMTVTNDVAPMQKIRVRARPTREPPQGEGTRPSPIESAFALASQFSHIDNETNSEQYGWSQVSTTM